ncbi:MAG: VCBS repeat-containing protein [Saprospiraceae bacterium]|nr:VCBS repeat-containing protein [Saprospiraceae bacterium]
MSHLFEATGSYSVTLKASGLGCSADTTVWVLINGPCGLAPEPVQKVFTSTQKPFVGRDILVLEDGTVVYCGAQKSKPMVAKWDGLGNLLWNKVLDNDGIFNQIEVLPDGSFILIGQADLKMVIAKIDGTGNFIWAKTLENTGSDYYPVQELNRMLAVNPDGSMGIYYSDNYDQKRYLVKISADGEILWAKRFNQIGSQASLRRATDGSGDFLLMSAGTFMTSSFSISIFRFNQTSGVALNGFLYYFPNEDMQYYSNLDLAVHPDGGFSAFWVDEKFPTGVDVYKHLARFSANGSVIWAKKYLLDAPSLLKTSSMRPLPNNKGWFFMDSRANSSNVDIGNFLQRIDSDGKLVWERKWSEPSYQTVNLVPTWQSNRVRGVASEGYLLDIKLINFQDGTTPMSCLPFETPNTEVENFHPKQSKLFSNVSSVTLQLQPLPINLLNYDLTGSTICAAVMPCPEICDNQIDDDGDFFIDCFDDDCHCAPIDTVECFVDYDMPEFAMKLGWQTKTGLQMFDTSTPLVGNLNPQFDSIPEVVMAGWSGVPNEANIYIYQGDGSDKDSPKTLAVPGILSWQGPSQFTLADLDSDGVPELIALCSDQKIRIFTQFDPNSDPPMQLWATSVQATKYTKGMLSVADFDSDNVPEIYIGSQIFKLTLNPPNAPDLQLVLSGTAANGYSSAGTSLVSSTASDILSTAECFGDPDCAGLELVAGYSIYSVDLSTTDGDGLQIKEKYNLNSVDPSSLVYADGFAAVADINLDGSPEVVLNTRRGSGSTYSNGVAVWNRQGLQRFYATNDISGIYGSGGQILIANVFDDKKAGFSKNMPEIIVAGQYELFCFNQNKATQSPNSPFWWTLTTEEQSGRTSASAFDFNGDGMLEIAYRDEKNLRILYGGPSPFPFGVDEHRKWASFPLTSGTGDEYPVVADIDHDNQAEIVVSGIRIAPGTPNHGCISVFESDSRPWMPARSVWNQYNYFNVNINDDLTVPAVQQKHWTEAPIPGSGKRPYNTHLVQGTATDSVIAFREKVPDAQLFFETITCHFDSFELLLKICNQGSATLPPGTPISFYLGNPTTTAAPLLVPPINLPQALEKGACFDLNLMIPAAYNTEIFAIANDNGNLPQPFNLTADFPSTGQKECNYENNLISFIFQHNPPILDLGPNVLLCNNSVVELNAQTNFSSYRWHDGSAQSSFTAFSPGTYWVEAKDKCGFVQSDTIKIELNTTVALDLPNEQIVCEGELVHLAIPGFATYQWYPSDSVSCADCVEVDVVAAQSITIYLTASDGTCIVTDSVRVIKSPPPQVSLYVQHGDCDTPASITAQSGSEDYMFLWSNGATEAIIYPEEAAAYFVTISDAQGCIGVDSIAVQIVENDLSMSFQTSLIPCEGGPGIIQASGFGGSGQFAFVWSTTETTSIIEVFQPGDYYVTLTDLSGTGCTYVDTVSITTRGELELETTVTMVSCAGMQDAAVQVLPVDGVSPYTWLWQNGQTDTTLIGLSAGTYIVTITDAIGCTGAGVVLITEPLSLLLDASADNLTLCSDGTTSVFALVEGGTPPYSFFWDNGQTDSLIIVATAGNYAVTLTDMRGCTAVDSVQIGSIPPFSILLDSLNHASGPTHADGSVFVHTSGGLSPFSYLWSNGDTTQNLTSVAPGNYSLTVTDGAGCTQMMLAEVGFGSSVGQLPAHGWDARIQPNPVRQGADSQLIIESISVQEVEVKLFDAIGRSLWKERFEWAGERFQQPIKTPATAGVYFVVLAGGRELKCLRWVVD